MSIPTYPLATPGASAFPQALLEATFDLVRRQTGGAIGSGRDFVVDTAPAQWKAAIKTRKLQVSEIAEWRAFARALSGQSRFFTLTDPLHQFPGVYMPAGPPVLTRASPYGGSFDGHAMLSGIGSSNIATSEGRDLIAFGPPWPLPVGLQLSGGDMIELRQGVNLLGAPTDFSVDWTPSQCTISANSATDPLAGSTAATLTATGSSGVGPLLGQTTGVNSAGQGARFSVWLKASTGFTGNARLALYDSVSGHEAFLTSVTPTSAWQRFEASGLFLPTETGAICAQLLFPAGVMLAWNPMVTLTASEMISLHQVVDPAPAAADSTGYVGGLWVEPELPTSLITGLGGAVVNLFSPRGKFRMIDFQMPVQATGRNRPGQATFTALSTLM